MVKKQQKWKEVENKLLKNDEKSSIMNLVII